MGSATTKLAKHQEAKEACKILQQYPESFPRKTLGGYHPNLRQKQQQVRKKQRSFSLYTKTYTPGKIIT